jgi:hypothetical protein
LTGRLATTACSGDLGFIEADFGVFLECFGDEVATGDSGGITRWKEGGAASEQSG